MYKEKKSTKLLRMVLSIRNDLDQIEHSETCKFLEVRRLEQLDQAFTASLFQTLIDEVIAWKTYQTVTDFPPNYLKTFQKTERNF